MMHPTETIRPPAPSGAAERMRRRRAILKEKNICPVCGRRCLICSVIHAEADKESHYPENLPPDVKPLASTCAKCSNQAKDRARQWHAQTRDYVAEVHTPRICDQLSATLGALLAPVPVAEYFRKDRLEYLTAREREVLRLRYSKERPTLATLSDVYGVSKQRIQKIEATALQKAIEVHMPMGNTNGQT